MKTEEAAEILNRIILDMNKVCKVRPPFSIMSNFLPLPQQIVLRAYTNIERMVDVNLREIESGEVRKMIIEKTITAMFDMAETLKEQIKILEKME